MKESSSGGRRGIGRRRLLVSSAGLAGAAALAAACGGGGSGGSGSSSSNSGGGGAFSSLASATPRPTVAADQAKKGGIYRQTNAITTVDIWDPHTSLTHAGLLWQYVGNQALRPTPDVSKLEPELVQKWEIPGDGTEIILKTRPGVNWHNKPPTNGRTWDAEDLAFNIMRITAKLNPDRIAQFSRRTSLPNLDRAEAVDAATVRVKLSSPHSSFLNGFGDFRNSMVPKDFVEKGGKFEDATAIAGTGAFTITEYENLKKAAFKAVPNWDTPRPYIDGVESLFFSDRVSYLAAFTKGDVDSFEQPNRVERQNLKQVAPKAREEKWIQHSIHSLRFNVTRKPFDDQRVRKAIFLALDYKRLADGTIGEGYWEWTGSLSPVFPEAISATDVAKMPGYSPESKQADLKTARELMTAAGFPDGKITVRILASSAQDESAVRSVDQLKQVWPAMEVSVDIAADSVVFGTRQTATADFDVVSYTYGGAADPVLEVESQFHSNGSRNYGKFKDEGLDQLIDKASRDLNNASRTATLREAQLRAIEQSSLIKTYVNLAIVYFQPWIKGMEGYGRRNSFGSYDTRHYAKHMWIDKGN